MSSSSARRIARLALAGLTLCAASSAALACEDDETYLFACQTTNPARAIYLCGREEDTGEGMHWTGIRYLYRTEKGDELSYPENPAEGPQKLFFSHLFRHGLYEASVRFENGGYSYRLFFKDAPESTEPGTVNGPAGGVEVSKDGKPVATIQCGEKPAWYFDETRKLLACDLENPFGAQGCSADVPTVP